MTLARPLSVLRPELRETAIADLPTALLTLDELLPDGSEKKAVVTALRAALNQLNKDSYRGVIDQSAYALRLAQINANFIDLLDALTEADFEMPAIAKSAPSGPKRGSVLYKIPRRMPLRKVSLCTVRVAVDEEAILDDLLLDDGVRIRNRVEVSDMMSAELVDMEGHVFDVVALNTPRQRVRDTGYTQWLFRVVPLIEGEHQLMVKVSLMEFDPNIREYVPREVSILETVTIVTEAPAPSDIQDTPLRATGDQFSLSPAEKGAISSDQLPNFELPNFELQTLNNPTSTAQPRSSSPLRAAALFLAFLMVGTTATFAFSPKDTKDWLWARYIQDDETAYTDFIDKHPQSKYVEDAAYRRTLIAPTVSNLRVAETFVRNEQRRAAVLEKLNKVEISELQTLRANPTSEHLQQFLKDFPHSEQLGKAVEAVAAHPELRAAAETRAFEALQQQPTARNIELFRTVFPDSQRKNEVQRLSENAQLPATSKLPVSSAEEQDWQTALSANTLEAYATFVNKYKTSSHRPEARQRVLALRPASPDEQAWTDATFDNNAPNYIYFVQKYPQSAHASEARQRIKTFSLNKKQRLRLEAAAAARIKTEQAKPSDGLTSSEPITNPTPTTTPAITSSAPEPEALTPSNGGAGGGSSFRKSGIHDVVSVTGGTFLMGSPDSEKDRAIEECQHTVTVKTFSIGKYEVTQADWREVMGSDPPELEFKGCDDCPVESVSWNDIQDFLKKLNTKYPGKKYRLPTEAEWEYAARGGAKNAAIATGGGFRYAGSDDISKVTWYDNNAGSKTHPVGGKKANELGIYDMSGNVYEWCQDKYGPYPGCNSSEGSYRVRRGGSWSNTAQGCRSAYRGHWLPGFRGGNLGIRLALAPQ